MSINQEHTPLVEALRKYDRNHVVRFHVPGHGGGPGLPAAIRWGNLPGWDVTELAGLDDLHNPAGVIAAAQQSAAELYNARCTFFLVNGTTVGLQALIAATCSEDKALVLPRNVHRSVLGGLLFSGARPVFIDPVIVPGFDFAAGFLPDKLDIALRQNPGAGAVLAVHPCYYGVVGDLAGVDKVCRRHGVPLLVDEAHGTHLCLHPDLPADALSLGADAVVQSVHKTGGALTQASWLHLGSDRIARERVADALRLLQTSSPSYILMASLDAARRQLALQGQSRLDLLLALAEEAADKINQIPGLAVLGKEHLLVPGAVDYDPTRLVISVQGLGIGGYAAARELAAAHGIYIEMSDTNNLVIVLSLGAGRSDVLALVSALTEISRSVGAGQTVGRNCNGLPPAGPPLPLQAMTPRQAWLAGQKKVALEEARGLVGAEIIAVYPPGIAVIYPGEEITPEVIEYLLQVREIGLHIQGAADPTLTTMRVVDI
ncbi:aminotransferase class I/II-fold pyridoxal phosphate-dependent enzyme [Desulfoscipio gibsoniae]|uniref:Arginine/lysine/ornithine decarboxylase n=1 Tax=Desulfoscipio gibsoniae DSM 7213 TaxID=767817 RepID=R4KGQ8_9FIRM|nr:aminotransferase class I/II-fold pyridoxal phosphate-dependent enzyme [Desulfoscipio gibsoniae]AGK99704.1 arginine/lysine/ornithine decarboxylase [Desulfoscipio gibsoniae DSM 7213]